MSDPVSCQAGEAARRPEHTESLPDGDPHTSVRRLLLVVEDGPDRGKTFRSTGIRTVVGSHRRADVRLHDSAVSRFHCEIHVDGGAPQIRDLGSRNGTFIDGVQIDNARLRAGARLEMGRTTLRIETGLDRIMLPLSQRDRFGELRGQSVAMRRVFAALERAAEVDITTLLEGETGTGKDLAARAVHQHSERRGGPFVVVDCGAIPRMLLESQLFGHERGAFTGAHAIRQGAFELAAGGTLFLDEVGELDRDLQPKLLRVVESRSITRVGSSKPIPIDVRLIAATNRNLRAEVTTGRFRSDLYYRLAVLTIELPPLRSRPDDIPLIAQALLERVGADEDARAWLASPDVIAELRRHSWPGNARELRNYLERAVALRTAPPVVAIDDQAAAAPTIDVSQPLRHARTRWIQYFERRYLEEILLRHQNNVTEAARAAGLNRAHFHRLLSRSRLR